MFTLLDYKTAKLRPAVLMNPKPNNQKTVKIRNKQQTPIAGAFTTLGILLNVIV
jgi:hypothetical protein